MKKVIALFLLLAIFISSFSFSVSAAASDNINTTDVLSDLEKMYINGELFNSKRYPADSKADYITVLSFLEYGYDYSGDQRDYGIYIYIYNPSQVQFVKSNKNKIQIGTEAGGVKNKYYKYELEEISHSADYRFYKYKIADLRPSTSGSYIYQTVFSSERIYHVSGIELLSQGSYNAHDYEVSGTYKYSGYMKGYRQDPSSPSSLRCIEESLLTIQLDLNWTVYRTQTSSYGINHQNEIMTVYFAFPNELFDQFDYLYSIQGEYSEYKIESIVTESSAAFNQWKNYLGRDLSSFSGFNSQYDFLPGYYRFCAYRDYTSADRYLTKVIFNDPHSDDIVNCDYVLQNVPYFYYVPSIKGDGQIDVAPYEVIDKVNTEGLYYMDGGVTEDGHRQGLVSYDIKLDDTYELKSYRSEFEWWEYMLAGHWYHDYINLPADDVTFQPILHYTGEDISMDASTFSDMYLIYEDDVDTFKKYYKDQTLQGNAVHLFRFTANDYYSEPLDLYDANGSRVGGVYSYYARQTYIDDFDICSLTFMTYDEALVVVPVVADPVDIAGGLNAPPKLDNWLLTLIMLILGAIFFGFILWLIYKLTIFVVDSFGAGNKSGRSSSGSKKRRRKSTRRRS